MTDVRGSGPSPAGPIQSLVGRLVSTVAGNERRRVAVVVAVPLLFWLSVELAANLGFLPLVAAVGLAAFLYTRATGRETLAATAYGTGLLAVAVALIQVYRTVAGGTTASVVDTAVGQWPWAVAGTVLVGIGVWLHQTEI